MREYAPIRGEASLHLMRDRILKRNLAQSPQFLGEGESLIPSCIIWCSWHLDLATQMAQVFFGRLSLTKPLISFRNFDTEPSESHVPYDTATSHRHHSLNFTKIFLFWGSATPLGNNYILFICSSSCFLYHEAPRAISHVISFLFLRHRGICGCVFGLI